MGVARESQLSLVPVRHLYRVGAPHTSGQAADEHDASGRRLNHAELVLSAVRSNPGLTAAEYGRWTELGHIEAQRRLSDLKNAHQVRQGPSQICAVKGTRMVTWWPEMVVSG